MLYRILNVPVEVCGTILVAPSLDAIFTISMFEGGKSSVPLSSSKLHNVLSIDVSGFIGLSVHSGYAT